MSTKSFIIHKDCNMCRYSLETYAPYTDRPRCPIHGSLQEVNQSPCFTSSNNINIPATQPSDATNLQEVINMDGPIFKPGTIIPITQPSDATNLQEIIKMGDNSFVTKDSGKRESFESGMVRDTQDGKLRFDLVYDGPMLKRWAALLTRGAVKYFAKNWMKADSVAELERARSSAARHFFQWMNGEVDEDHAAAVMFNINLAEYVKEKKDLPF